MVITGRFGYDITYIEKSYPVLINFYLSTTILH